MNKKVPLVIIGFLLLLIIILLVLFKDEIEEDNDNSEVTYKYMVIDDFSVWGYDDKSWSRLGKSVIEDKSMDVYVDYKYLGYYKLKYANSWNLFDNSNNYVDYDGTMIAVSRDLNVSIDNINITNIDVNDLSIINSLVNKNVNTRNLSVNEKVMIDLDHNGVLDYLVNVSDVRNDIDEDKFNLCYVILNGKTMVIFNEVVSSRDDLMAPMYSITGVVGLKGELSKNIILTRSYFSNVGRTGNIMYSYVNGEYKEVIKDVK